MAQALRDQQLQRTGIDGWLIPGRHAQHITADRLQQRLKRYGIERSREGRHAALLALAARLPAPILAERIGIHQSRAAAWVRMAGGIYADDVAFGGQAGVSAGAPRLRTDAELWSVRRRVAI
jgi:hypothetical protein